MKYGRYRAACAVMAMSMAFAGCGEKSLLDAKNPVTIEIWNYYNGDQLTAFDSLVEEFNATVGKEEGIIVESKSQGSVNDLETNVLAALREEVGAAELPNIFMAYADTAYTADELGGIVDLRGFLTDGGVAP